MLESIAEDVWIADGPCVSFLGFPFSTRMGIVRLPSGALWVWSPVALDDALAAEVDALGEVKHLVEPNMLHHLGLPAWKKRWPSARMYAPPGLRRRFAGLHYEADLGDAPEPAFEDGIEHVIVHGSFAMEEVLFFHRASRTLFVGDLIQKQDPRKFARWQGWLLRLDGLAGPDGSTPREWRLTFFNRKAARAAIRHALGWNPVRMVIAHGTWARSNATEVFRSSLSWLKP